MELSYYRYKPSSLKVLNRAQQIKRADFLISKKINPVHGNSICNGVIDGQSQPFCDQIMTITMYCKEKIWHLNQVRSFDEQGREFNTFVLPESLYQVSRVDNRASLAEVNRTDPKAPIVRFFKTVCSK